MRCKECGKKIRESEMHMENVFLNDFGEQVVEYYCKDCLDNAYLISIPCILSRIVNKENQNDDGKINRIG